MALAIRQIIITYPYSIILWIIKIYKIKRITETERYKKSIISIKCISSILQADYLFIL